MEDEGMQSFQTPERLDRIAVGSMVLNSLREVLAQSDQSAPDDLGEDTALVGRNAILDSLGFVTLIVDLEQRLEEGHNVSLILTNDRAMSQKNSPFRTVQSLSDYILDLLAEEL
jgi:acyl carrier protein